MSKKGYNRRRFLKTATKGALGTAALYSIPSIVPATVFGKTAPSNMINIGQIGCGRIALGHDLPETFKHSAARIVAVADVDRKRKENGKKTIEGWYAKKTGKDNYIDVKMYDDYHDMLASKDVDAVIISTPDHWHAQPAIEAALAGKHIYLQKPTSLTIEEGRQMSDYVRKSGVVFQLGSQQRSENPWPQFKKACELVRNGRIGKLHTVRIGLPFDPSGGNPVEMPIPEHLNYDFWLGSTPYVYYTRDRVHPDDVNGRGGWLRIEQFGAGMITGWGVHHIDIAHWGMNTELTGPIEVEATAEFPKTGLWNVHGKYNVIAKYANGVTMQVGGDNPNGVKFEGTDGWIFVTRGNVGVTASDPTSGDKKSKAFDASDPKILTSEIKPNETHLYSSPEQHANWLDCIINKKQTISPVEVAHRSCSACLMAHIAMKVPGKLYWDPKKEQFKDNVEANKLLSRPQRYPYGTNYIKTNKKA
jgi:Predicted dehydrogenases and related proteins